MTLGGRPNSGVSMPGVRRVGLAGADDSGVATDGDLGMVIVAVSIRDRDDVGISNVLMSLP